MSLGQSKRWTRAFLYVASLLPDVLYGWPVVLFCRVFWGEALAWEDGVMRCRARDGSWLARKYGEKWGGVTLSPHAILYMDIDLWPEDHAEPQPIQRHEHVHVEQGEAAQLAAALEALVLFVVLLIVSEPVWAGVLPALLWATGHARMAGIASLTAFLRGEKGVGEYAGAYVGSHTEESARALTDPTHDELHDRDE